MANEQFNEDIKLEEAINKYGGDDEQYKNTLKKHVRNYLGYSNYVKQMNQMPGIDDPGAKKVMGGGVEDSYLRGNITPAGVRQLTGAGINLRNQEMGYLQQLAKGANSAGKSSATTAEAAKAEFDKISQQLGEAGNYPEALMKDWINNPINDDGTFKTPEQFKETLTQHLTSGEYGAMTAEEAKKMAEETVNKYLPIDKQEDLQRLYYQSLGATENQIEQAILTERIAKGDVSEAELNFWKTTNPALVQKAETMKDSPGLQTELMKVQGNADGAKSYSDLARDYAVTPEVAKPFYEMAFLDDIQRDLPEIGESLIPAEGLEPISFDSFISHPAVVSYRKELDAMYRDILTPADMNRLLFQYYLQQTSQGATNVNSQGGVGTGGSSW